MDSMLLKQALIKFFAGLLVIGLLLFVPAGTISYWQAWLLIGILFVPMFIAGLNFRFKWIILPDWYHMPLRLFS